MPVRSVPARPPIPPQRRVSQRAEKEPARTGGRGQPLKRAEPPAAPAPVPIPRHASPLNVIDVSGLQEIREAVEELSLRARLLDDNAAGVTPSDAADKNCSTAAWLERLREDGKKSLERHVAVVVFISLSLVVILVGLFSSGLFWANAWDTISVARHRTQQSRRQSVAPPPPAPPRNLSMCRDITDETAPTFSRTIAPRR